MGTTPRRPLPPLELLRFDEGLRAIRTAERIANVRLRVRELKRQVARLAYLERERLRAPRYASGGLVGVPRRSWAWLRPLALGLLVAGVVAEYAWFAWLLFHTFGGC